MSELDAYDYVLPRELIAQHPVKQRTDARLLVVERAGGNLSHWHIRDLPSLLRRGDCLVVNDTKVVPARLLGRRAQTHGRWEGLYLGTDANGLWQLLCKSRGKLEAGQRIVVEGPPPAGELTLILVAKDDDGTWTARVDSDRDAYDLLDALGHVPLPPYIRGGQAVDSDRTRYQTVYAAHAGSVAAPTAGLHLTDALFEELAGSGVERVNVTLHVGPGTFRPITAASLAEHRMHSERGTIPAEAAARLQACRRRGGRIVAVGTTTARILETAAADGSFEAWSAATDLFIRPGHTFRAVDALLTNFHLPRSTLLVMVCALGGEQLIRRAYQDAIDQRYRFYSYGDAMLIT